MSATHDAPRPGRGPTIALLGLAAFVMAAVGFLLADDQPGGKEDSMWKGSATATAPETAKLETATFALG
ncbi:MAG: hypothetical protein AAB434_03125 [Planctomycetota bacterium]